MMELCYDNEACGLRHYLHCYLHLPASDYLFFIVVAEPLMVKTIDSAFFHKIALCPRSGLGRGVKFLVLQNTSIHIRLGEYAAAAGSSRISMQSIRVHVRGEKEAGGRRVGRKKRLGAQGEQN